VIRRALLLAATLAGLAGCGPRFDHLDFAETTSPPLPVSFAPHHVGIPAGIAVGVDVTPMDDGGGPLARDVPVVLSSSDEGVLGVAFQSMDGSSSGDDADKPNRSFVIFGVAPGSAAIHVLVDGEREADVPVTVAAQP